MPDPSTVLLVDDDQVVRNILAQMLKQQGYRLLEAADGAEALVLASEERNAVDLLITDVVMRPMDGIRLAEALSAQHPSLKVLLISGYGEDASVRAALSRAGCAFLLKPFTRVQLSEKIETLMTWTPPAAPPRAVTSCPACGGAGTVEIVGVLVGTIDSDWRTCSACSHLWSISADPDVFPLMVGNPNIAARASAERLPPAGFLRAKRFRVRLNTRYRVVSDDGGWRPALTENISRSGVLLRTADQDELQYLAATCPSVDLEIEVPHGGAITSGRIIRCQGEVIRHVEADMTDTRAGVAVAVRGYQLADTRRD